MRKDLLLKNYGIQRNVDIPSALLLVLVDHGMLKNSLIGSLGIIEELLGIGADDDLTGKLPVWVEEVLEQRIISHNVGKAR